MEHDIHHFLTGYAAAQLGWGFLGRNPKTVKAANLANQAFPNAMPDPNLRPESGVTNALQAPH
jgi:hypothetical protein